MTWDAPAQALWRAVYAFDAMANGEATEVVAEACAKRGDELLAETWARAQAPSGDPWAPPARAYGHPLLDESGDMKSSARVESTRVEASSFTLLFTVDDPKAVWHQRGTLRGGPTTSPLRAQNRKSGRGGQAERLHIPARPMLPESDADAAPWLAELERAGHETLERWLSARLAF